MTTQTYNLRQGPDRISITAGSVLEAKGIAYEQTGKDRWSLEATGACTITSDHCSQCGSTDNEDLYGPDADQGYTGCCNEPTTGTGRFCSADGDHN